MTKIRCAWVDGSKLYQDYHDFEWGVPVHDDDKLFELLCLESFQSGLSWITVLKKRADFNNAFDNFNPQKVALYDEQKINNLLQNKNIIRHRGKITATITNAKAFIKIQEKHGSFNKFIWTYVNNTPIKNNFETINQIPTTTPLSTKISQDLKNQGFKFLGPTTTYSYMQAIGLVDDHTTDCFLYKK